MTVLDASNSLVEWFLKNDSFCIEEDFNKIVLISENEERETAAVRAGLDKLIQLKLITRYEVHEKEYWVLSKPIEQYEQEVEINAALAKDIADVINEFCDEIEDQLDRCDSTDLSPKDIKNILLLCRHYKVQSLLDKNVD
jgi:hypothetical protein